MSPSGAHETLLALTPLRIEQWALRGAVPTRHTGMGRASSLRAAGGLPANCPLVVAGFAGGLDSRLRAGDVVVASAVAESAGPAITMTAPALLADALRAAGLTVYVGPLLTSSRVVRSAERAELKRTGALAVDMESAYLLAGVATARAVLRVVVDTPRFPLSHPNTIPAGYAALRTLRRSGPCLREWATMVVQNTSSNGAEVGE